MSTKKKDATTEMAAAIAAADDFAKASMEIQEISNLIQSEQAKVANEWEGELADLAAR